MNSNLNFQNGDDISYNFSNCTVINQNEISNSTAYDSNASPNYDHCINSYNTPNSIGLQLCLDQFKINVKNNIAINTTSNNNSAVPMESHPQSNTPLDPSSINGTVNCSYDIDSDMNGTPSNTTLNPQSNVWDPNSSFTCTSSQIINDSNVSVDDQEAMETSSPYIDADRIVYNPNTTFDVNEGINDFFPPPQYSTMSPNNIWTAENCTNCTPTPIEGSFEDWKYPNNFYLRDFDIQPSTINQSSCPMQETLNNTPYLNGGKECVRIGVLVHSKSSLQGLSSPQNVASNNSESFDLPYYNGSSNSANAFLHSVNQFNVSSSIIPTTEENYGTAYDYMNQEQRPSCMYTENSTNQDMANEIFAHNNVPNSVARVLTTPDTISGPEEIEMNNHDHNIKDSSYGNMVLEQSYNSQNNSNEILADFGPNPNTTEDSQILYADIQVNDSGVSTVKYKCNMLKNIINDCTFNMYPPCVVSICINKVITGELNIQSTINRIVHNQRINFTIGAGMEGQRTVPLGPVEETINHAQPTASDTNSGQEQNNPSSTETHSTAAQSSGMQNLTCPLSEEEYFLNFDNSFSLPGYIDFEVPIEPNQSTSNNYDTSLPSTSGANSTSTDTQNTQALDVDGNLATNMLLPGELQIIDSLCKILPSELPPTEISNEHTTMIENSNLPIIENPLPNHIENKEENTTDETEVPKKKFKFTIDEILKKD